MNRIVISACIKESGAGVKHLELQRLDLRESVSLTKQQLRAVIPRSGLSVDNVLDQISPIMTDIAQHGVVAVQKYTQQFDGLYLDRIKVSQAQLDIALEQLDSQLRQALENAIARVRAVHSDQLHKEIITTFSGGGKIIQRWIPIERVGLYVPGGRAVYPSSVIMNAVPALIAGVSSLVIASPPCKEYHGLPHPTVLATAALLGITEVWAVGGAAAIGLFAYGGTDTDDTPLESVDLITGPGNIYVAAAKRYIRDIVGIDTEAGPTEIAILADHNANVQFIAADLISQAEHDPLAASILVTTSVDLADAVARELDRQISTTKYKERICQALSGSQSSIILVSDLEQGIDVINAYACEHVEIHTDKPHDIAVRIKHAGAVFIGSYSPVSLGDYAAGSNHVLPTGATARYQSGLSVQTFLRHINYIDYDKDALADIASTVVLLAHAEDLPAHGQAVNIRINP